MTDIVRFIYAIALCLGLTLSCNPSPLVPVPSASVNPAWDFFSIGYDATWTEANNAYDFSAAPISSYDTAPIRNAVNKREPSKTRWAILHQIVDFKAAETGPNLASPGSKFTIAGVQATEFAGRLTPEELAGLLARHGTEFAQIYLTGPGQAGVAEPTI